MHEEYRDEIDRLDPDWDLVPRELRELHGKRVTMTGVDTLTHEWEETSGTVVICPAFFRPVVGFPVLDDRSVKPEGDDDDE